MKAIQGMVLMCFILVACSAQEQGILNDTVAIKQIPELSASEVLAGNYSSPQEIIVTGYVRQVMPRCTGNVCIPSNPCCQGCAADLKMFPNTTPEYYDEGIMLDTSCRGTNCAMDCGPYNRTGNYTLQGVAGERNERFESRDARDIRMDVTKILKSPSGEEFVFPLLSEADYRAYASWWLSDASNSGNRSKDCWTQAEGPESIEHYGVWPDEGQIIRLQCGCSIQIPKNGTGTRRVCVMPT